MSIELGCFLLDLVCFLSKIVFEPSINIKSKLILFNINLNQSK